MDSNLGRYQLGFVVSWPGLFMTNAGSMNNPPFGLRLRPLQASAQNSLERVRKHPVETRNQDFQFIAGAYSRILKIRE